MAPLRWRTLIGWALGGWLIGMVLAVGNLATSSDQLGGLVDVSPSKPAYGVIKQDFPDENMFQAGGDHDGPMFYAIARQPLHLDLVAPSLDRPRYRSQRILFPLVAWLLHPTGVGDGLLWTMFAVGAVGMFFGALGVAALSITLRGPPWVALIYPALTGSVLSLRLTEPDALALTLAIWAIVLSLRDHRVAAVLLATASILTKEPVFLVVVGFALWRRDRQAVWLVAVPVLVAGLWWGYLHATLPAGSGDVEELVWPLTGWRDAITFWSTYGEPLGMINAVAGVGLGVAGLIRRRFSHPLSWAVALNLALMVFMSTSVIGPERNASRAMLPLEVLGLLMLLCPGGSRTKLLRRRAATVEPVDDAAPSQATPGPQVLNFTTVKRSVSGWSMSRTIWIWSRLREYRFGSLGAHPSLGAAPVAR
jgi:hypothetical protein